MAGSKLSPMMQQYLDIKEKYRDCILFFRLGDFYEMFFDDAVLVSKELELTLTGKQCGMEERAPMCGVPFHAADAYIAKLVENDHKVAICEQVEDPASAKGIVAREVTQIVTPGTVLSGAILKESENNYIASVFSDGISIGLAYCDISTGEVNLTSVEGVGSRETLVNELVKTGAREIILDGKTADILDANYIKIVTGAYFDILGGEFYRPAAIREAIKRQFRTGALHGIGVEEDSAAEIALGAMLLYLLDMQKNDLSHLRKLHTYSMSQHMSLDKATIKNLEITETISESKKRNSLLGVLDRTKTAMGSRKMKQWLREPLSDAAMIRERLDAVQSLADNVILRGNIREGMKRVYDFERLTGRIATGKANGRDMTALKNSCFVIPDIKENLARLTDGEGGGEGLLKRLNGEIYPLEEVYDIINRGIDDEPPFTIREGGIIKAGYSQELDAMKASISDARGWIASLEATERERTGIKNLKVGYNKVFGYYIEITKSYFDLIPGDYIRKQTLVNCERFVTPQLKETERTVLNAENDINKLEYEIFSDIRKALQASIDRIQSTSRAIAELDVLVSFAAVAEANNYVKPEIDGGDVICIEKGRHPVIEQTISDGIFVSNDAYIDRSEANLLLITGPNMSGKSTYMRQIALIVLMAQAGAFVPCERARIGVCDKIFTRIGITDNLARGQSTFFVEMSELSYILNTASPRSLVILDEIGRGTSTYDGLSIAWSAAEYLCRPQRHIRTLFATHYHEMTVLEETTRGIKNLNVQVSEENGDVIFLHKIIEGCASRSYGIHVAKLAGAPQELLIKAQEHLDSLQDKRDHNIDAFEKKGSGGHEYAESEDEDQLSLFDALADPAFQKLREADLMDTKPSEALKILEELQKALAR